MERVIPIRIRDKIAAAPRDAVYVCGNSDYTIKFDFDDEWEGFNEKTARFVYNGQFVDMIFTGDVCPVPIISNTYAFEVGVYAGNLSTTTKAYIAATKSVLCGSNIPAEPVSVYVPASELEKKADKEYVDETIERKEEFAAVRVKERLVVRSLDGDGAVSLTAKGTTDDKDQRLILESDRNAPRICGVGEPVDDQDVANKKYVDNAVANVAGGGSGGTAATDVTDTINELLQSDVANQLHEGDFLLLIANVLYKQYQPGSYISHGGLGQYELYYSADFSSGGVSMKFMGNSAEFFINDLGEWSGFVLYNGETGQKVFYYAGDKQASYGLTGIAEPTEDSGAANKKYVDSAIQTALAAIPIAEEGAY